MPSAFSPTQAELALVNAIFTNADPNKLGIITGDAAIKAFAGAKLQPTVLGEVWAIADSDNNGFLTRKGVAMAVRLIGYVQKGQSVKESLLEAPGPLAHIEGISPTPPSRILSPPPTIPPRTAQQTRPPLTPEDKSKFLRLFLGCGPVNGLLPGDKARDVFVKSKLPYDKLSHIWALADTQDRGSLDQTDFTIAMYLIQAIMSGQMKDLPTTLPPGLYEQAGGRPLQGVATHGTGSSISQISPSINGSFSGAIPIAAQMTGSNANLRPLRPQTTGQDYNRMSMAFPPTQQPPSATFASNPGALLGANVFGGVSQTWDVTTEEKARFDQFFDSLDTQRHGFIEGDVAVPFMLQSKLSEDVLAQVWDLADLHNDGRLTRDGFAVAMHLIQGKLAGKDIPASLPLSLIPPSMRGAQQSTAPAPAPAPVSEIQDLLWDDEPVASPAPPKSPPVTSPSHFTPLQPQGTGQFAPLHPQNTGHLSQQATGMSTQTARAPPPIPQRHADPFGAPAFAPPPANRDFLADDEDLAPANVPDNSAEIGNLKNQVASTERSLETTRADRQSTEKQVESQAAELAALESQLSFAKAAYETEDRLLTALRERFSGQTADIASSREQLIRAESDLSAIRVEKAEIEGSLLRDKEEVRDVQKRMKEVGEDIEREKAAIEKAKKETKHQKGLLAIAKKQLASREAEKSRTAKELEEVQQEAQATLDDLQATESEIAKSAEGAVDAADADSPEAPIFTRNDSTTFAALQPLPMSPSESPAASIASPGAGKTNNPFERLVKQTTGSRPATPLTGAIDIFSVSTPQLQADTSSVSASTPPRVASPFKAPVESPLSASVPAVDTDPFGFAADEPSLESATPIETEEKASEEPTVAAATSPIESKEVEAEVIPSAIDEITSTSTSPGTAAAAAFPPLSAFEAAPVPSEEEKKAEAIDTDLSSKLFEKEEDDSDSDSDEGEFHDAKEARNSIGSPKIEEIAMDKKITVDKADDAPELPTTTTATSNFDDMFGFNAPAAAPSLSGSEAQDLFFTPPTTLKGKANGNLDTGFSFDAMPPMPANTSGLNAFDEAMGRLSTASNSTAPQFKLNAGFDDSFDFSAAKAELDSNPIPFPEPQTNGTSHTPIANTSEFGSMFHPSPEAAPAADSTPKVPAVAANGFSFDDAFGASQTGQSTSQPAGDLGISFEDTFGGASGSQALELKNSFDGQPSATSSAFSQSQDARRSSSEQPPVPPVHSPTKSSLKSARNPRSPSPPPRRSTGSGSVSDGTSSMKSPQRKSKLSIRLPFGRNKESKKKHDPPPMPPPHFLTPVAEPASENGTGTPGAEDDVAPVKKLCDMGFSRGQAVAALETHGYDVQRALNSLLGTQ